VSHIVLVGDSILDNRAYTEGGPDVVSQVQELLPHGSHATLLAVDGSTTEDIRSQAQRIPSDATNLVLSAGGNDAIMNSDLLLKPLDSTAKALAVLADVAQEFEKKYRRAVAACRKTGLPLTICTIYPNFRTGTISDFFAPHGVQRCHLAGASSSTRVIDSVFPPSPKITRTHRTSEGGAKTPAHRRQPSKREVRVRGSYW
jgi:hypothetical protein